MRERPKKNNFFLLNKLNEKWMSTTTAVVVGGHSVTRKKSPNVYKSCPKMISLEK